MEQIPKWLRKAAVGAVLVALGAGGSSYLPMDMQAAPSVELDTHTAIDGHPVMVERVRAMTATLQRIEDKIDRLAERP